MEKEVDKMALAGLGWEGNSAALSPASPRKQFQPNTPWSPAVLDWEGSSVPCHEHLEERRWLGRGWA